jgi:DNA repair ATPase RecN
MFKEYVMDLIKLPELPQVIIKGIVTVKSEDLRTLVDAYNSAIKIITAQHTAIQAITDTLLNVSETQAELQTTVAAHDAAVQRNSAELKTCREDIGKVAKILEEIYET